MAVAMLASPVRELICSVAALQLLRRQAASLALGRSATLIWKKSQAHRPLYPLRPKMPLRWHFSLASVPAAAHPPTMAWTRPNLAGDRAAARP